MRAAFLNLVPAAIAAGLLVAPMAATAHNGVVHKNQAEAERHRAEEQAALAAALEKAGPIGGLFPTNIGGGYALIDHNGAPRTEKDPDGRAQLVFFGYASCEAICSVAMPRVAEATAALEAEGLMVTPVMITVDREHDTPAAMKASLEAIHPRYVGLTGSTEALAAAEKAFQVESEVVSRTRDGAPIYAHGSFIYLMDGEGGFLTLFPPIQSPEWMAATVKRYLTEQPADG